MVNPDHAKEIYVNFQPLDAVPRYRDPQPQVVENYLIFVSFETKHLQILIFKQSFNSQ